MSVDLQPTAEGVEEKGNRPHRQCSVETGALQVAWTVFWQYRLLLVCVCVSGVRVWLCLCVGVSTHICVFVFVYVVYTYMCVCVCVCVCVYARACLACAREQCL